MKNENLFGHSLRNGIRAVVTGQVGVDKRPFLERVVQVAKRQGHDLVLANVGDRMYAEAPDVSPGRILDLPLGRLNSLRRSVFKDILALARQNVNLIVNTHATFRWRHGLFPAFDHDQLQALDADLYFTLVDSVDAVHERISRDHDIDHRLKDILVWREEEILATEVVATMIRGHGRFYIISRGDLDTAALMLYRLIFEPGRKRVYPSFPMTHVMNLPDVLAELQAFRDVLAENFVTFDPGDLDEKWLLIEAANADRNGQSTLSFDLHGRTLTFETRQVMDVARDIDGQIYARDFKLIDQSHMIISYIPQLADGRPGLSSGVERELQHAYEASKEVFVIWRPSREPSPFITETATRVFNTVQDALAFFQQRGDLPTAQHDASAARHDIAAPAKDTAVGGCEPQAQTPARPKTTLF
ncbi:MAG: AAA family ATPase [Phycisphaerae bacterium]|nr:AAA family ATPase [Phycisphaerae bacterium]